MDRIDGPYSVHRNSRIRCRHSQEWEHLLDLINDILDLAKIDAGKLELRECNITLTEIVTDCVTLVNARAQSGGVSVTTQIAPGGPDLHADKRAVKQVLLNFLSNAIKFTPHGGRVSVVGQVDTDGNFELSVIDDGIGMSAAEIEVALSPFGQIDSRLARQHVVRVGIAGFAPVDATARATLL